MEHADGMRRRDRILRLRSTEGRLGPAGREALQFRRRLVLRAAPADAHRLRRSRVCDGSTPAATEASAANIFVYGAEAPEGCGGIRELSFDRLT